MTSAAPSRSRRFIGRTSELEALHARRRELGSGRGSITLVGGNAGIGKTRLLAEFLRSVAGGRAPLVIRAECLEFGGATFGPIREIVGTLVARGGTQLDAVAAQALEQGSFFSAIESLIREAAKKRAIVVCIEDLHWADRTTLDFVAYWATRIATTRAAAFVTYRDDEIEARPEANAALARIARTSAAHTTALQPFDDTSMKAILTDRFERGAPPAPTLVRSVVARAAGNPFFGEELLKHALEVGTQAQDELPQSIKASILERYLMLAATDRDILAHAAILGYRFDPDALVDIFGFDRESVARTLRNANARLLVIEEPAPHVRFRFRHALTHETIAGEMLEYEARPLHASVAATYESLPDAPARIADIAYHRWKARDAARAAVANEAAGDAALALYAYEDAATLYMRALEFADLPDDIGRLCGRIGQILTFAGDHALAIEFYERALEIELASIAYAHASITVRRIAGRLASLGRDDSGHARLDAFARDYHDRLTAVDRLLVTGWGLLFDLGGGRPRAWRERLRALEGTARASAANSWGIVLLEVNADADLGDIVAWADSVARLRRLAEDSSVNERAMTLLQIAVTAAYASVDDAIVRAAIDEATTFCDRFGLLSLKRYIATARAFDRFLHGDLREARLAAHLALADASDVNQLANLAVFAPSIGLEVDDRDLVAISADERVLERFWSTTSHGSALVAAGIAGRLLSVQRREEARRVLERAIDGLETLLGTQVLLPLAAQHVETSPSRARIHELLANVYPSDRSSLATRAMVMATFAARDRSPECIALAREAAARYARLGWPLLQAAALKLAGDTDAACALVRACSIDYAELKTPSIPLERRKSSRNMTPREYQIATGIAEGLANTTIADSLGISVKTVESHLSRIYARLGFRSRAQLATYVSRSDHEAKPKP